MTITLTDEFSKTEKDNFTVCYDSSKAAVFALREDFSSAEGAADLTLSDYAQLVISSNEANGKEISELKSIDGFTYFEYEAVSEKDNKTYSYYAYFFKEDTAFWAVQFATLTEDLSEQLPNITEWAKSIKFE